MPRLVGYSDEGRDLAGLDEQHRPVAILLHDLGGHEISLEHVEARGLSDRPLRKPAAAAIDEPEVLGSGCEGAAKDASAVPPESDGPEIVTCTDWLR